MVFIGISGEGERRARLVDVTLASCIPSTVGLSFSVRLCEVFEPESDESSLDEDEDDDDSSSSSFFAWTGSLTFRTAG